MIAKVLRSGSFKRVVAYSTSKSEDAQLIYTQNLGATDDVGLMAAEMELTASIDDDKCKKPAYHLIVNWDPLDMVGSDAMRYVAKRLLDKLGLSEHQAVVGEHKDKKHPHMHIVVNRVHPLHGEVGPDGKKYGVWKGWKDYEIIEDELRKMEREFGWREVEGRNALQMGHQVPARTGSSQKEYHERKRKKLPQKKRGRTWDETHERLHAQMSSGAIPPYLPKTARHLYGIWGAAECGDAECQWKMSRMYSLGIGVPFDEGIAAGWAQLAARQGHLRAIEDLRDLRKRGARPVLPPLPAGESERKYVGMGGYRPGRKPKDWIGEWAGERAGGLEAG